MSKLAVTACSERENTAILINVTKRIKYGQITVSKSAIYICLAGMCIVSLDVWEMEISSRVASRRLNYSTSNPSLQTMSWNKEKIANEHN